MRIVMKVRCVFVCLLCIGLMGAIAAKKSKKVEKTPVDWTNPESIDPLSKGVGDFLDEDPGYYTWKATEAYRQKKYKRAAAYYLAVLRHNIHDTASLYNLACCYGLMGKPKLAALNLARAVRAGFTNFKQLKQDSDFDKVRKDKSFDTALRKIFSWEKTLGNTKYVTAQKLVKYRIRLPEHFDSSKSYPLLIGLHGNGGNSEWFIALWSHFHQPEFIFAAPEGPYPRQLRAGGAGGEYSWEIQVRDKDLWAKGDPLSLNFVADVARDISKQYKIDNVYLMGFSQGAAYAYMTGIKNPDIFHGIICFGGILPDPGKPYSVLTEDNMKRSKNLRIFIAHGKQDQALKYEVGVNAKKILKKYGYNVTFCDFEGGHTMPPEILKKAAAWMKD